MTVFLFRGPRLGEGGGSSWLGLGLREAWGGFRLPSLLSWEFDDVSSEASSASLSSDGSGESSEGAGYGKEKAEDKDVILAPVVQSKVVAAPASASASCSSSFFRWWRTAAALGCTSRSGGQATSRGI